MKLIKPSAGLSAEFKAMAPRLSHGELRKMFGYDAVFVNGNLAVGLWQNTCVVKVSPAHQAELLERGLAVPLQTRKGVVMTGWLELSEELAHDPEDLFTWSQRAVTFVAALPPKVKKPSKKAAAKPKPRKPPPTKRPLAKPLANKPPSKPKKKP